MIMVKKGDFGNIMKVEGMSKKNSVGGWNRGKWVRFLKWIVKGRVMSVRKVKGMRIGKIMRKSFVEKGVR